MTADCAVEPADRQPAIGSDHRPDRV